MRNDALFTIKGNLAISMTLSRLADLYGVETTDVLLLHLRCYVADHSGFTDPGFPKEQ